MKIGNERYPALTGIRALGATAVFFAHLPFNLGFPFIVDILAFFFVLSGFLIVYLYYRNAEVISGRFYNYFVNRFARIYPVYFLLVTIAILLKHDFQPVYLLKNYTLTHSLFHDNSIRAIDASWSLTVEECFYLLAPLLMLLIRRFNFFVSLMSGVFLLLIALIISKSNAPFLFLQSPAFIFSTTFFGHFVEFFAGMFVALLILKREQMGNVIIKGSTWTTAGSFGVIVLFACIIIIQKRDGQLEQTVFTGFNNFLLPLPIAILYIGLITENTYLSRVLSGKLLGLLGRTSYSFYLVHKLVIVYIAVPYLLKYFGGAYNLYVLVIFIITQLIALIIFVFYEEPLNHFIRKRFRKRIPPAVLAA